MLSVGRYTIRYRTVHSLDISDAFHALALGLLIALTIQLTVSAPLAKMLYFPDSGDEPTTEDVEVYLRYQLASSFTWLIAIYCVKFSFLFLYRELFSISARFMRAWWASSLFTFSSFWVCLVTILVHCDGKAFGNSNQGAFPEIEQNIMFSDLNKPFAQRSRTSHCSVDFPLSSAL